MKEITVQKKTKLVKLLNDEGFSYASVRKALRKRDIKVNGKRVSDDAVLLSGDVVVAYIEPPARDLCEPIYEDGNILAVHKYQAVTSDELFENLSAERELYYVHRLDRNTDGIIVFAKTAVAAEELTEGFKARRFKKYYLAEVYGTFREKSGVLSDYLVKDADNAEVKIYKTQVSGAVTVKTAYRVLAESENTSLLEIELITGRTHQIRAHLAHYGHFVIGDGKYGKEKINRALGESMQRLTAYRLQFVFGKDSALAYLNGKTLEIDKKYASERFYSRLYGKSE